jgi:hypothetical protein
VRDRREFANAISQLKEGMPQSKVLDLLGKPDDMRTQNDAGGISTTNTRAVWRYGTSGHLTTATLGQVYIGHDGRVQYVFGKGTPPKDLPDEARLRELLNILGEVPSYNSGGSYNPRFVIRAVNALQPLGKERALAVIDEFLRVASHWDDDGREGMFLVLRTLFDVPADPGYMRRMMVGAAGPEPKDPKLLPRFPVALEQDIPLLTVSGYTLAGQAEPPEFHVEYFRKQGTIRAKPLHPTDQPIQMLAEFEQSPRWPFRGEHLDGEGECLVGEQVLRLMDTVYRTEPDSYGSLLPIGGKDSADKRREILAAAGKLKIRWDPVTCRYTFLDGTCLPEIKAKQYRREVWKIRHQRLNGEVVVERQSPRLVSFSVSEQYDTRKARLGATVKLVDAAARDKPLAVLQIGKLAKGGHTTAVTAIAGDNASSRTSQTLELNEGVAVQVLAIVDDTRLEGPTFKP